MGTAVFTWTAKTTVPIYISRKCLTVLWYFSKNEQIRKMTTTPKNLINKQDGILKRARSDEMFCLLRKKLKKRICICLLGSWDYIRLKITTFGKTEQIHNMTTIFTHYHFCQKITQQRLWSQSDSGLTIWIMWVSQFL